jgi:hypothetical protein
MTVVAKDQTVLGGLWGIYMVKNSNTNNQPLLVMQIGNSSANPSYLTSYAGSHVLTQGWHHIALVVDRPTITLYLDNVADAVAIGNLSNYTFDNSGNLEFARQFKGRLDEWSFYNRALSAAELEEIRDNGKCHDYIRQDQVANCQNASSGTASYTVFNGHSQALDYRWGVAGLPAGGDCIVDGPSTFSPNSGTFTLNACSDTTFSFDIPCDPLQQGNFSCYQLSMQPGEENYCLKNTAIGTNFARSKKEEFPEGSNYSQGLIVYSSVSLSKSNFPGESDVLVSPNPSQNDFVLEVTNPEELINSVKLFDALGREVAINISDQNARQIVIPGQQLRPGIYYADCTISQRCIRVKLIKVQ